MLRLPGVYAPQDDSHLLLTAVLDAGVPHGARICDLGTGSGFLALNLAAAGAREVIAVDIGRRAVLGTRLNARLRGLPVRALRGDLLERAPGQFDVITANPPYVPAPPGGVRPQGRARSWDAGRDGRAVLDRLCAQAPGRLRSGGSLWIVHSVLCGVQPTLEHLTGSGLTAEVVEKADVPFGPVLRSRAAWLRAEGLLGEGEGTESLVVIRGKRA